MTPSIRTFLLINLLLSVILITSFAIVGNIFLARSDIQNHENAQMVRTALRINAFFSATNSSQNQQYIDSIQQNILNQPNPALKQLIYDSHLNKDRLFAEGFQIQVWNAQGKLLLYSQKSPKEPFSDGNSGFSKHVKHDTTWFVYTLKDPTSNLTIMIGDQMHFHHQLTKTLTKDSFIILLITFPLLGLLIWGIVGKALGTLKKVAKAVRSKAPSNLEPVHIESVPNEIEPLVTELNSLFARLQEAFTREKRFTADAAHELRTPLAALNTHTQIALRAKTPQERKDALLKVLAGVNRGTHVVQQLLTLSRMVPEASINEPECMDLSKEATEIAAQLAPEAISKNIDLELIAPEDEPANIIGNPTAIGILLRNLVDNAIRYSPKDSSVSIRIEKFPDRIILRVIDNGPGIPPELRERVFERFFRVLGTTAQGSGLGLGIVLQIVKLHQADLKLETPENGKGLDFQVIFKKLC